MAFAGLDLLFSYFKKQHHTSPSDISKDFLPLGEPRMTTLDNSTSQKNQKKLELEKVIGNTTCCCPISKSKTVFPISQCESLLYISQQN